MNRRQNDETNPPALNDLGRRLRDEIIPHLRRSGEADLCRQLRLRWSRADLRNLLPHPDADIVQAAAACLGLVGTFGDCAALSRALQHDDYFVTTAAECALWHIWMRSSRKPGRDLLRQAVERIQDAAYEEAETLLDQVLLHDPDFAEAANQRAIVYYLTERFEMSIVACNRALAANPYHFGAAAGLGHNYFQLGQYRAALAAYGRALNLHPRMAGVRQAMRRTREAAQVAPEHHPAPATTDVVVGFPAPQRPDF